MAIEDFLGSTAEEIASRKAELRAKIPTTPGSGYLRVRLKKFEVQPWPLVTYLAYNAPDRLGEALHMYVGYDGAENGQAIMEQLREYYILARVLLDIEKAKQTTK